MVRRSDPLESTPPAFGDEAVLALAGFIVVISWKSRVVRKPQGPEAFWACSGAHPCPSGRITGRHRGMRGTGTAITRPRWSAWTTPPGPCSPRLIAEPPRVHFPASDSGSRARSEEHTSELQSQSNLVCRLLLEKKNTKTFTPPSGFIEAIHPPKVKLPTDA